MSSPDLYLYAGSGVMAALVPCAFVALRGSAERRLVGLQMGTLLITLALVLLTIGYNRLPFIDLALTLAVLSFGSGLVFARFLEKHL